MTFQITLDKGGPLQHGPIGSICVAGRKFEDLKHDWLVISNWRVLEEDHVASKPSEIKGPRRSAERLPGFEGRVGLRCITEDLPWRRLGLLLSRYLRQCPGCILAGQLLRGSLPVRFGLGSEPIALDWEPA